VSLILKQTSRANTPVKIYACSRRGNTSIPKTDPSKVSIVNQTLDIASSSSIQSFAKKVAQDDGHVDVLINNAGINDLDTSSGVSASDVVGVNYGGTKEMCETFLPLLAKSPNAEKGDARIVNLSSVASELDDKYSPEMCKRFRDEKMTSDGLQGLVQSYLVKAGQGGKEQEKAGFGNANGYCFSKASVNALTAVLARQTKKERSGVLVNCCCPGWVDTEMGGIMGKPPKSPGKSFSFVEMRFCWILMLISWIEDGARIPFKLGFGDVGGISGRYWSNPGISDRADGSVTEW